MQELEYYPVGRKEINVVIHGCFGIPEWIEHQNMGSEVTVELPLNWYEDDNFLGFAFFFHHVPLGDYDGFKNRGSGFPEYEFMMTSQSGHSELVKTVYIGSISKFYWIDGLFHGGTSCNNGKLDPALSVTFLPQIAISRKHRSNQWRNFKASLKVFYLCGNSIDFKMRSCGISLLYAQDHHQYIQRKENTGFNIKRSCDGVDQSIAERHQKRPRHL